MNLPVKLLLLKDWSTDSPTPVQNSAFESHVPEMQQNYSRYIDHLEKLADGQNVSETDLMNARYRVGIIAHRTDNSMASGNHFRVLVFHRFIKK